MQQVTPSKEYYKKDTQRNYMSESKWVWLNGGSPIKMALVGFMLWSSWLHRL